MLKFHADQFVLLSRYFGLMEGMIHFDKYTSEEDKKRLAARITGFMGSIKPLLEKTGLRLSYKKATAYKEDASPETILQFIEELQSRIVDELEDGTYLFLSEAESQLYEPSIPLWGEIVEEKFPSIFFEIKESAKCQALDRSTASVFHSIRCLESGIRAISRCIGIPDPTRASERSWMKMLGAIRNELDRRWPNSANKMSEDYLLIDGIYASLAAIQNPYRNTTMHLDATYTQDDARHIFEMVGGLMKKISSRMDEQGLPLA